MHLKANRLFLALGLSFAATLAAQTPTINAGGVVNAASYAYAGLPSGGIAQGSIFAIFGTNLGPTPFAQPSGYPIPTTLGGVSVKVTSGSTTGQAYLFLASSGQITAMLPSNIPVGTASLTVTNGSATSAPQSFQVVSSSFGTFALNSGGSGPGVITNANVVPFGLTKAANPDEAAVIWGTGLAPVSGNEAGGALPGDQPNLPVEVYVGNSKATVTYRGRSGCCAGLDQIVFNVPNVLGCRVPVTIKINNVVSNSTTIPVAAKGSRTCTDAGGPSAADLAKYAQNGASVGVVTLNRVATSITVPFLGAITTNADVGAAVFTKYTPAQLDASGNPFNTQQIGSCTVSYYKGSAPTTGQDPTLPKTLDAGSAITINGAAGTKSLAKTALGGYLSYSGLLSTIGATGAVDYLNPGTYTATGPGGAEVGGFTSSITIPSSLNWTNQAALTDITRSSGQAVTWTGGDPNGTILITGSSASGTAADSVGAAFTCIAKSTDNSFTIPAQVLLALPVSVTVQGIPTGVLSVGQTGAPKSFTASGVDAGYMLYTNLAAKTLNYK